MNICLCGISHKTSSIDVREKFFLREVERELLLSELKNDPAVSEALILSTCNRTEIYAQMIDEAPQRLFEYLCRIKKMPSPGQFRDSFYFCSGQSAVEHLLRVAAGLDSIILGEKQILGQVKRAVDLSRHKGMLGRTFNILSNIAIRAGKKARHETLIGMGGSSVSWAAVTMARRILADAEEKSILILGAGKMGKLAAGHLQGKGFDRMYFMNRTDARARTLAGQFGGEAVSFWDMRDILRNVRLVICSAGAPHYLIEKKIVASVMAERRGRPLTMIDISVPRNIDPLVAQVPDVSLLTVDDLEGVVERNIKSRKEAVAAVEQIVGEKVSAFYAKIFQSLQADFSARLLINQY